MEEVKAGDIKLTSCFFSGYGRFENLCVRVATMLDGRLS